MYRCIFSDYWNASLCPYDILILFLIVMFMFFLCILTVKYSDKLYKKEIQKLKKKKLKISPVIRIGK